MNISKRITGKSKSLLYTPFYRFVRIPLKIIPNTMKNTSNIVRVYYKIYRHQKRVIPAWLISAKPTKHQERSRESSKSDYGTYWILKQT